MFPAEQAIRRTSLALGLAVLAVALGLALDPDGFRIVAGMPVRWGRSWTLPELTAIAGIGLVLGGYLNVVIHRLPRWEAMRLRRQAWADLGDEAAARREAPSLPPDVVTGRSRCVHCQAPIPLWLATPLLGWCGLRGRSACCGQPIPLRYPLVELVTMILVIALAVRFGVDPRLPAAIVLAAALMALAVIDQEQGILPDRLTLPLLWYGLAVNALGAFVFPGQAIGGAIAGYLGIRAVRAVHARFTGRIGLGLGDAKLVAALGAWTGPEGLLHLVPVATLAAVGVLGIRTLFGRAGRHQRHPLGPWLVGAALAWGLAPDALRAGFDVLFRS